MSHVWAHSQVVTWTLGATLAAWLPLGAIAAAVWSMRSQKGHAGRVVYVCSCWPLWVLGIVLVGYATDMVHGIGADFIYEPFIVATKKLDGAAAPILLAALVAAVVIGWQLRPVRRRSWQVVCAATLIAGSFAFWSTRARALDTAVSLTLTEGEMWGEYVPKMQDLPEGESCHPPTPDAIDVRFERRGGRVDGWDPPTHDDMFDLLDRKLRIANGRRLHIHVAVEPGIDAHKALSRLDALLSEHKNVTAERLYRTRLPAVHSHTLGRAIPRIQPCALPMPR